MKQDWEKNLPRLIHDAKALLRAPMLKAQLLRTKMGGADAEQLQLLQSIVEGQNALESFLNRVSALNEAGRLKDRSAWNTVETAVLAVKIATKKDLEQIGGQLGLGRLPACQIPTSLERILIELISNSIRFRSDSRPLAIRIEAELNENVLKLRYSDNSLGWDPRYTPQIFDPFERLDRSRGGFGIGLAIVRAMLNSCGGEIHAATDTDASRFDLEIPAA
jgi:signal transduction histidine kinase